MASLITCGSKIQGCVQIVSALATMLDCSQNGHLELHLKLGE